MVRLTDWWNDKLPPLVAVAALSNMAAHRSATSGLRLLGLFMASAVGIAAFGHAMNDLADIAVDAAAGKPNRIGTLSGPSRVAVLVGCLLLGGVPWLWLPTYRLGRGLVVAEAMLLIAYSVPPVRLKVRGLLGPAADALYASVIPVLLALVVFGPSTGRPPAGLIVLVGALCALMGLRGIVWHQMLDLVHDRMSGVATFVGRTGRSAALRVLDAMAVVEVLVLAVLVVVAARGVRSPALIIVGVAYVPWRLFEVTHLWPVGEFSARPPDSGRLTRLLGYGISMGIVQRLLPLLSLIVLSIRQPVWWAVTAVYLLLFETAASEAVRHRGIDLLDGAAHLYAEPEIHRVASRVAAEVSSHRSPSPSVGSTESSPPGRWVFVFCGPSVHAATMATAVRHLRGLSTHEIWVVTDSARNESPVDSDGVDHVVDVPTPAHLDDHQAAIWLKTSVHRHLPSGVWCYLDTDIVAISRGADRVFELRDGPVVFAPDLPLEGNTIDHFSPHAMTCSCEARGLLTCAHLRRQLSERFDLDVPAGWTHWNGGVFVFGPDAEPFLERWHELAVASFEWPEWRTRDQGALIASAWQLGLQDLPRLPQEFNFIVADPYREDVYLDATSGWSLGRSGPWLHPRLLHLFQPGLDSSDWDLEREVLVPVVRRTLRLDRERQFERWRTETRQRLVRRREALRRTYWRVRIASGNWLRARYWTVRERVELAALRMRRRIGRLQPSRIRARVRRSSKRDGG